MIFDQERFISTTSNLVPHVPHVPHVPRPLPGIILIGKSRRGTGTGFQQDGEAHAAQLQHGRGCEAYPQLTWKVQNCWGCWPNFGDVDGISRDLGKPLGNLFPGEQLLWRMLSGKTESFDFHLTSSGKNCFLPHRLQTQNRFSPFSTSWTSQCVRSDLL